MKYAKGEMAWGRCQRCGDRVKYKELLSDGQVKGLKVCNGCFDIKHPTERPFRNTEGIALKKPSPDNDGDSTGGAALSTLLGGYTFGG